MAEVSIREMEAVVNYVQKGKGTLKIRKMYFSALAALLSALSLGMTVAYSSQALPDMTKPNSTITLEGEDGTWIGSLTLLGALFGTIIGGSLSNLFGRRGILLYCSLPFIAGWMFIVFAKAVIFIFVGRVITGFCCGLIAVSGPIYLVEISTPEIRGLFGTGFQVASATGIFMSSSLGAIVSWSMLALISSIMPLILLIVLYFFPESPRWLAVKGKRVEAIESISYLQGHYLDPKAELLSIEEDIRKQPKGKLSLKDFMKPTILRPALLSLTLTFFQQMSGISPITNYTTSIFQEAGSAIDPFFATVIVNAVQVFATVVVSALLDKVGRKVLLFISGLSMALSHGAIGIFEYLSERDTAVRSAYGWIPVACIVFFIISYSIGYGPIPFLMIPEMTPTKARGLVCSIAFTMCFVSAFVVSKLFDMMKNNLHLYGLYWFYGCSCFLSIFFIWFLLPETKGRALEDMEALFAGKKQKSQKKQELPTLSGIVSSDQIK